MAQGFKKAVKLHQKFYKDRGFDVQVKANIEYERDGNETTEEPSRLTTVVIFPSLKLKVFRRIFTEQDQKDFNAFTHLQRKHKSCCSKIKLLVELIKQGIL